MQTNMNISKNTKLYKLGQALLKAGADYWEEYQNVCGSSAVVWLEVDNGHFILFTRSEYKRSIMQHVPSLQTEAGMVHPFTEENDNMKQEPMPVVDCPKCKTYMCIANDSDDHVLIYFCANCEKRIVQCPKCKKLVEDRSNEERKNWYVEKLPLIAYYCKECQEESKNSAILFLI